MLRLIYGEFDEGDQNTAITLSHDRRAGTNTLAVSIQFYLSLPRDPSFSFCLGCESTYRGWICIGIPTSTPYVRSFRGTTRQAKAHIAGRLPQELLHHS